MGTDISAERVSTASAAKTGRANKSRRRIRRRISGLLLLLAGLFAAGTLAAVLTPDAQVATADSGNSAMITAGKQLYETSCITCHGANLEGVPERGPSLIGVGDASVYFQVSTGRMPAVRAEAQIHRKPPKFTQAQIDQLGSYIQAMGGGPRVLYETDDAGNIVYQDVTVFNAEGDEVVTQFPVLAQESLRGDNIARGSELFRLNCASCHNFTGRGGALSSGKFAPELSGVNEQQLYTAMITGPQNMPRFSNRQLSIDEKEDIIAFVRYVDEANTSGGYGLGGFGPVSEGLTMWVIGITLVVAGAMWIGSRN